MMDREIEERRRNDADVDDVSSGPGEAIDERGVKAGAREPAVSSDGETRRPSRVASRGEHLSETTAEPSREVVREIAIGSASNIVLAKNV